jgi:phosphatidylglycerol:prolipoprotein diacylglycerol transferase
MHPVLFRIGSHIVFSYTVALVVGMALGTWVSYRLAQERLSDPGLLLDAAFWALLGGILGGRAAYVVANWAYYADHLRQAFDLSAGGLIWHGSLLGGGLAIALWFLVRVGLDLATPDWREFLDVLAPGLALGGAFGWLGALLTGSAYGAEASGYLPPLAWFSADLPDIYGVSALRFATQPAMIAVNLALFAVLWALRKRLRGGLLFALYLGVYAAADLAIGFLRGDGTWRWGLWLWQWMALGGIVLSVGLATYVGCRSSHQL